MDLSKDLDPVVHEKMKKNLVYVSCFSIVMLFAGLSSAYIVSMGDAFWLETTLPGAFWWSTACIVTSSLTFIASISYAKKDNLLLTKVGMLSSLIFGLFSFTFNGQVLGN